MSIPTITRTDSECLQYLITQFIAITILNYLSTLSLGTPASSFALVVAAAFTLLDLAACLVLFVCFGVRLLSVVCIATHVTTGRALRSRWRRRAGTVHTKGNGFVALQDFHSDCSSLPIVQQQRVSSSTNKPWIHLPRCGCCYYSIISRLSPESGACRRRISSGTLVHPGLYFVLTKRNNTMSELRTMMKMMRSSSQTSGKEKLQLLKQKPVRYRRHIHLIVLTLI